MGQFDKHTWILWGLLEDPDEVMGQFDKHTWILWACTTNSPGDNPNLFIFSTCGVDPHQGASTVALTGIRVLLKSAHHFGSYPILLVMEVLPTLFHPNYLKIDFL